VGSRISEWNVVRTANPLKPLVVRIELPRAPHERTTPCRLPHSSGAAHPNDPVLALMFASVVFVNTALSNTAGYQCGVIGLGAAAGLDGVGDPSRTCHLTPVTRYTVPQRNRVAILELTTV
jgi:hypothetical protein